MKIHDRFFPILREETAMPDEASRYSHSRAALTILRNTVETQGLDDALYWLRDNEDLIRRGLEEEANATNQRNATRAEKFAPVVMLFAVGAGIALTASLVNRAKNN